MESTDQKAHSARTTYAALLQSSGVSSTDQSVVQELQKIRKRHNSDVLVA